MSQQDRNEMRDRKGETHRPYDPAERRYSSGRQDERERNESRMISASMDRRSARENDLYERQSI